jgi:hypothetical protein
MAHRNLRREKSTQPMPACEAGYVAGLDRDVAVPSPAVVGGCPVGNRGFALTGPSAPLRFELVMALCGLATAVLVAVVTRGRLAYSNNQPVNRSAVPWTATNARN